MSALCLFFWRCFCFHDGWACQRLKADAKRVDALATRDGRSGSPMECGLILARITSPSQAYHLCDGHRFMLQPVMHVVVLVAMQKRSRVLVGTRCLMSYVTKARSTTPTSGLEMIVDVVDMRTKPCQRKTERWPLQHPPRCGKAFQCPVVSLKPIGRCRWGDPWQCSRRCAHPRCASERYRDFSTGPIAKLMYLPPASGSLRSARTAASGTRGTPHGICMPQAQCLARANATVNPNAAEEGIGVEPLCRCASGMVPLLVPCTQ